MVRGFGVPAGAAQRRTGVSSANVDPGRMTSDRGRRRAIRRRGAATAEYEALGVARISYGPMTQRVALTALQDAAADLYRDGVIPSSTRSLN